MDYGLQHKNIHNNITKSLRNDICQYEIHHMALYTYFHLSSVYFFASHSAKKYFCSFESTVQSTNDHFKPSISKLHNIATRTNPACLHCSMGIHLVLPGEDLMKGLHHMNTKLCMYITYCPIFDLLNYLCVARKPAGNIIICEFL